MAGKKKSNTANTASDDQPPSQDPYPNLVVERGPEDKGVGTWVPNDKHRVLRHYLDATKYAWRKWPSRVFIDPFSGPGRIQVAGESFTRPGGTVVAYEALAKDAPFTKVFVGDLDAERAQANEQRLKAIGADATSFIGPADQTVKAMVSAVPQRSLCMAFLDPYNLEHLSFSILQDLSALRNVDLAINFSTMDLQRNVDLEFDPQRARFDRVAPNWRHLPAIENTSRQNLQVLFFNYWCDLVKGLSFKHSHEMPWVENNRGHRIYRMVFFARHDFPSGIWDEVARGRQTDMFSS